jgi:hypothetical protein
MSYFAQLQQNVVIAATNSSVAPLGAGLTFSGPSALPNSQSTLGVVGLQVNLFTNQNCTVYVDQSMDGDNWDITDTFDYHYYTGGNSWTVQATAAYVRVRVKNVSLGLATPFRLQTALCPIVEAVPRSLDSYGCLKTTIQHLTGQFNTDTLVSPANALKVVDSTRLIGSGFGTIFDTNFWTKTANTGTSTSTVTNDILTLQTNPGGAGGSGNSAIVNSALAARYVNGNSNYCRQQIMCPTSVGVNTRRWGAFDASNGYYFKWNGTTFYVGSRKGGVDIDIPSSAFNGVLGTDYQIDTYLHTYEIVWVRRTAWFLVDSKALHNIVVTDTPNTNTFHLKIGFENTNGANTNNNILYCLSGSVNRLGSYTTQPRSAWISSVSTTLLKTGPGNLRGLVFGTMPTAAGTVTIYDGVTTGGTVMWSGLVTRAAQASTPVSIDFQGVPFSTGLTVDVVTNAVPVMVMYE